MLADRGPQPLPDLHGLDGFAPIEGDGLGIVAHVENSVARVGFRYGDVVVSALWWACRATEFATVLITANPPTKRNSGFEMLIRMATWTVTSLTFVIRLDRDGGDHIAKWLDLGGDALIRIVDHLVAGDFVIGPPIEVVDQFGRQPLPPMQVQPRFHIVLQQGAEGVQPPTPRPTPRRSTQNSGTLRAIAALVVYWVMNEK